MVFRSFERVSFGLVMHATLPCTCMHIGDKGPETLIPNHAGG